MTKPTDGFRPETVVAIEVARQAVATARSGAGANDIISKGARDIVTATDVAIEDAVRATLVEALGHPVIGEERGGEAPPGGAPYWLVDPICGTRNFASGIPLYCVNLALVEGDQVTVAVVGDPSTDEILVAERGAGALALNRDTRRPLAASDESSALVAEHGLSHGARRERAARFIADAILTDRWDLRMLSSTLPLCYVAAGRVAALVLFRASAVHAAAGSLLAAEAGATVSDIDGQPWTIHSDSIVASANAGLHRDLLALAGADQDVTADPD